MGAECIHREVIAFTNAKIGEEIGTCLKCGQTKRYYWEHHGPFHMERKAEILKPGGTKMPKVKMGPFQRLNERQRRELLKIGPQAFGDKYGYLPKGRGSLIKIYRKHEAELASESTPETPPEVIPLTEPLTAFEEATLKVLEGLAKQLEDQEKTMNELGISIERIKLEIVAYGTALDIYRSRFRAST